MGFIFASLRTTCNNWATCFKIWSLGKYCLIGGPGLYKVLDIIADMESRLGHANMMMFLWKCIGKIQHQKLPQNRIILLFKIGPGDILLIKIGPSGILTGQFSMDEKKVVQIDD